MKKIFLLLFLFVLAKTGYSQFPITQYLGSDSAIVKSRGGLQGRFAPIPFTDTSQANTSRISQYPGALIYTSGVDKYWYRNATTTAWIEFTSSGGSTVNIYNSNGTISEDRYVDGGEHRLQFNSLQSFQVAADSITFNLVENYLFLTGLVSTQDTSTYKPIVVDPITGRVLQSSYWYGGSSIDTTSLSNRINAKADTNSVWFKTGNSGTNPSVNYIGTNDEQPLVFKTNGLHAGLITARSGFSASVSGSVVLGQFAGDSLGVNNGANTLIGHGAGANLKYNPSKGNQNTMVGMWAGYATKYHSDIFGGRNVMVGQASGFRNYNGSSLTYVGTFAGELNNQGNVNTGLGRDALRSNIDGSYNVAVGGLSALYNTTGIKNITVTNGGSGYTTADVSISAPPAISPGVFQSTATATATISGGQITSITVTDPGGGYSLLLGEGDFHTGITVTITGDGSGATAEVTETISGEGNTALGYGSGYLDRFGKYNISIGYLTTLNNQLGENVVLLGTGAGVSTGSPTPILNSVAIGKNAKVSASNTMALGGVGADSLSVVIGGTSTTAGFELINSKGAIIDSITIDAKGLSVGEQTSMAIGIGAMKNATGLYSTAIGYKSQEIPGSTSNQAHNTSVGSFTLQKVTQFGNSAFGSNSSKEVTTGYRNTGFGAFSNGTLSTGRSNTSVGFWSLYNTNGLFNTGFGDGAGASITTGSYNTSIGSYSMGFSTLTYFPGTAQLTGSYNSGLGVGSLFNLTSGSYNTAVGFSSGISMTTGSYNTLIGNYSGAYHATVSRHTIISDGEGNIRFTADSVGNTAFYGTGGHKFQSGTTAQRPTNVAGVTRWNTDSSALEYSDGSSWFKIGASAGGGSGTVTSVGTGYGLSGGTITTTGTILVDSASLSSYYLRRKDSLTSSNLFGYVTRTVLADSASAIRSAIIGGGTPAGNYGNIQLNRNGAFAAAGSDSLNFTGGAITVKGEMTMNGASPVLNFGTAAGNPEIAATASSLIFRRNDLGAYIGVTLGDIDAGANKFVVTGGNILKINNVATSFPSSQGAANSFLMNNGSGTLTWDASVVLNTRTISTTSPLSGGGDLSANRTLSIADAAADGTTKGAASFTASDFNSSAANISIDYTNGQKATSVQPGFMTATQAAKLDSNIYFQSGEGVEIYVVNDSTYGFKLKYDTTALASFGAGSAAAGDTTAFSTSAIYGSFFNSGSDTLIITRMQIGLQGTSPNITLDVFWNDSLNVSAGATKLVTAGNTATNIYTGTSVTSFDNTKIPPGNWVWVKSSTVAVKPTYLTTTLIGYKKRVTP